jgi:hypothetical protein
MNASHNTKSVSTIEEQLSSVQMSQRQRNAALHDARFGEFFADAIMWVCGRAEQPHANVFAKPNLKY